MIGRTSVGGSMVLSNPQYAAAQVMGIPQYAPTQVVANGMPTAYPQRMSISAPSYSQAYVQAPQVFQTISKAAPAPPPPAPSTPAPKSKSTAAASVVMTPSPSVMSTMVYGAPPAVPQAVPQMVVQAPTGTPGITIRGGQHVMESVAISREELIRQGRLKVMDASGNVSTVGGPPVQTYAATLPAVGAAPPSAPVATRDIVQEQPPIQQEPELQQVPAEAFAEQQVAVEQPQVVDPQMVASEEPMVLELGFLQAVGLNAFGWLGTDNVVATCEVRKQDGSVAHMVASNAVSGTVEPVWNELYHLDGWAPGDDLVFGVNNAEGLDVDQPEGKYALPWDVFYPGGWEGSMPLDESGQAALFVRVVPITAQEAAAAAQQPMEEMQPGMEQMPMGAEEVAPIGVDAVEPQGPPKNRLARAGFDV